MNNPDAIWAMQLSRSNLPPDSASIDLNQATQTRDFLTRMGAPIPPDGILTREMFVSAMMMQSEARARNQGGQPPVIVMVPQQGQGNGGNGGNGGPDGYDNGGNNDRGNWDRGNGGDRANRDRRNEKKDAEEERPVALRYGKLPKDLPEWFEELDQDKDGQVALWEWRKGGRSMAEFEDMDLNKDGLITADELLRWKQLREDQAFVESVNADGVRPRNATASGGRGSPNGRDGREGRGGPPKGGNPPADAEASDKVSNGDKPAAPEKVDRGPPQGKGPDRGGSKENNPWQPSKDPAARKGKN